METIPLHRTTIIRPFTQFLSEIGAPINHTLRQVKLPIQAIDDSDCYISSRSFWSFVEMIAVREGIDNLGFLVGKRAGANAIDPNFSKLLAQSPTLYHALLETCRVASTTISRTVMSISHTNQGTARFCHRTSFGIEHPNHHRMEWFAIMAMMGIIREFTGSSWRPKEIGLMSYRTPNHTASRHFPDCRFMNGQVCGFVGIETPLLSLPPLARTNNGVVESDEKSISNAPGKPANDFVGSLKQVLQGYLREGTPPIAIAAEISRTSSRTLQRQLAKSRLSYLDLLAQIRYDEATRLLPEKELPIKEIAYRLGYNDASHFSRAFRRFAGVSPTDYRKYWNKDNQRS